MCHHTVTIQHIPHHVSSGSSHDFIIQILDYVIIRLKDTTRSLDHEVMPRQTTVSGYITTTVIHLLQYSKIMFFHVSTLIFLSHGQSARI